MNAQYRGAAMVIVSLCFSQQARSPGSLSRSRKVSLPLQDEYFGDGIAEEITNVLAQMAGQDQM